ncbi:MAG: alkaline phosphatase family protein [Thermodesulfobacteriota bacterium]
MGIIKRLLSRAHPENKLFVLSLDGVSHTFARRLAASGVMPNLGRLLPQGALAAVDSVLPTVSTVAWASYMTGVNPGKHGIFGLVDRHPNPFSTLIPTSRDIKAPTLWEILGRAGKRVGVINVPLTYPPRKVNGFMVAGFLSPDLAQATFPVELAPRLMEMDYRIEVDISLAHSEPEMFLSELAETMTRRFKAAFQLMSEEPWEFFQLHLTGPDRINHFYWAAWEDGEEEAGRRFEEFYRLLDSYLGELLEQLPAGCPLVLVSDHGFTRTLGVVYINHWLEQNGYLLFGRGKKELKNQHPDSKAYSLIPGRIYINLQGREQTGSVVQGRPYEELREELIHRIGGLSHPETGQALVKKVHRREDIYHGPHVIKAPDLVIEPAPGFDFKANLGVKGLLAPPETSGMHTYEDALFYLGGMRAELPGQGLKLEDVASVLLSVMKIATPPSMDGRPLA